MDWAPLLRTRAQGWTILVRLMVGLVVFLPEGFQKLAFPEVLGAGRFANIGIPYPEVMGPFVGRVEIVCGALIILGLFTRLAAIPLIVIMVVAITSTKLPIWAGHDVWIFHMPKARSLRLLEHGPRSARRFPDAAGVDLPADRRGGRVVSRCFAGPRAQPFASAPGVKR